MKHTDFLSIRDFSPDEIRELLELGAAVKKDPSGYCKALDGRALALLTRRLSRRVRRCLAAREAGTMLYLEGQKSPWLT